MPAMLQGRADSSSRLENLARSADPKVGVALHLGAEIRVVLIFLHALFEAGNVFDLKFENDAVEFAGQIGEHAVPGNVSDGGGCFELGGQFAGMARFGDEAIANDEHERVSSRMYPCPHGGDVTL